MDRAKLIARNWNDEFVWSGTLAKTHDNLTVIAKRVLAAVEQAEPTEAAISRAVLICCGVGSLVDEELRVFADSDSTQP